MTTNRISIHSIASRVPENAYSQEFARERMKHWVRDPRLSRLAHAIYSRSGIETRHSVCPDFGHPHGGDLFKLDAEGFLIPPSTAERNALFAKTSRPLAVETAREAIASCPGLTPDRVTHVIYASCTGFANPGPDYYIVRDLGLRPDTQRFTLGFMGCYAAIPALHMAAQFCRADPDAVVLVVCLELCSLHIQVNDQPDTLLANSLFADGAAAAIVSSAPIDPERGGFEIRHFEAGLIPSGETAMAWSIGNHGFDITLSSYVPDIIGRDLSEHLLPMLLRAGLNPDEVASWAVHPGGRAILDKVESSISLPCGSLAIPREVLRQYGNMSSATILFVLQRILRSRISGPVCGMAFGPGLTLETCLLDAVPAVLRVSEPMETAFA